ncbi:tetratricopeptide repeat protein [Maricaulis sp. W15]|uniref:tetratricopeptide repeat protein n=1 Tax=Maricaulis sp. W15 TaxID=1772333 RepID=UPI000A9C4496|nr:SEL1-like repeat protein [Maricaulis sp. W15]
MLRICLLGACLLAGWLALGSAPAMAQTPPPSLREMAESGDPEAAYAYGYELSFPEEGEPDTVTGRYWLVQAADAGLAPANHMLGVIYRDGFGVDPDIDRARAFFELAWQAADPSAGHDLAELMLYDYDGERDAAIAILETLLSDVELGPLASLTLAETLMFDGDGEVDAARAVTLARDALDRQPDLMRAHYILGIGAAEGLAGPRDPDAARRAWEAGAEAGDTLALMALADSWLDPGWGETDPIEARVLYELAAELGDDDAAQQAAVLADEQANTSDDDVAARRAAWQLRLGWNDMPD